MDYGCSMALRVVSSLILTRLLMPESFGLMTLVSTLVVGISLFADIGMGPNVIQSPRGDDPVFLNTVWTLEVFRGLGIFVVCLLLAWPLSLIYHEPRLISLIPALAFSLVVNGFKSTNLTLDGAAHGCAQSVCTGLYYPDFRIADHSRVRIAISVGVGAGHRIDSERRLPARAEP